MAMETLQVRVIPVRVGKRVKPQTVTLLQQIRHDCWAVLDENETCIGAIPLVEFLRFGGMPVGDPLVKLVEDAILAYQVTEGG